MQELLLNISSTLLIINMICGLILSLNAVFGETTHKILAVPFMISMVMFWVCIIVYRI